MAQPEAQAKAPLALSSRDVARMLGIGEATVKRWADDGILKCRKTPGGHRRFSFSAVAEFRKKQPGWGITWPDAPDLAREALKRKAMAGDGEGLTALVLAGIDSGLTVEELCDDWIGPMLVQIGEGWAAGEIAIAKEHIASAAVAEMLSQLNPFFGAESDSGVAVTACLPGERHDLGSRMAGLILRTEGYRVIQVGAESPVKDLMAEVEREHANLLALGGQIGQPDGMAALIELAPWASSRKVRLIVGGRGHTGKNLPVGVEWLGSFRALKRALRKW